MRRERSTLLGQRGLISGHYTPLQGYREEIRRIALYLRAEQVALTRRHIARYLTQPAILRDPKVRELLREVCREVGKHT